MSRMPHRSSAVGAQANLTDVARSMRRAAVILLAAVLSSCRGESEVIIDGLWPPCVVVAMTPQQATVAVGDSAAFTVHVSFGEQCADDTREIRWSLSDTTVARIGPSTDSSAYVVGTKPGHTTLEAEPLADESSAGAAAITIAGT